MGEGSLFPETVPRFLALGGLLLVGLALAAVAAGFIESRLARARASGALPEPGPGSPFIADDASGRTYRIVRERFERGDFADDLTAQAYFHAALSEPAYLAPFLRFHAEPPERWNEVLRTGQFFWAFNGADGPRDEAASALFDRILAEKVDREQSFARRFGWLSYALLALNAALAFAALASTRHTGYGKGVMIAVLVAGIALSRMGAVIVGEPRGGVSGLLLTVPGWLAAAIFHGLWWPAWGPTGPVAITLLGLLAIVGVAASWAAHAFGAAH